MSIASMDKVLKELGNIKVLTLQVASGHRINIGRFYIEVLYPWDGFYDSLRNW